MAKVRIKGDTSGHIDLTVPAVAGTHSCSLSDVISVTGMVSGDDMDVTGNVTATDVTASGDVQADQFTTDGNAKKAVWRPVKHTTTADDLYFKIATIVGGQSTRVSITLTGRTEFGSGSIPGETKAIFQNNNNNTYEGEVFHLFSTNGKQAVDNLSLVTVSSTTVDVYVKVDGYTALTAEAVVSDGSITTYSNVTADGTTTEPTNNRVLTAHNITTGGGGPTVVKSSEIAYSTFGNYGYRVTHGQSTAPDQVYLQLLIKTAEDGWAVGDVINLYSSQEFDETDYVFNCYGNATYMGCQYNSKSLILQYMPYGPGTGGGGSGNDYPITSTSHRYRFVGIWY